MIDAPNVHKTLDHIPPGLVYVATPYTPFAEIGREAEAHAKAAHWCGRLGRQGYTAISPVAIGHLMAVAWGHDEWMRWCWRLFVRCEGVVVPNIEFREKSKGIAIEMEWATRRNMPVAWL